ncbi:MAG TPA: HAMP domain-containing sensor histidine kinase [Solirubrobacteraceae bacterium]|nr:HAMP domain-containing sensor histidine kinase [Solirubrobacteraceae bacterium]
MIATPELALPVALLGWPVAALLLVLHRRRSELVARAVHEIAGPLNAAGLAVHAARRERGPGARLAAIDLELRRAARALEDLDAARAGRRARDSERAVDVGALLAQQALAWQGVAAARGASLRIAAASGLIVHGDAVRLAQAVGNLLANAIEHGGGRIELRATAAGERVRVEVLDGGPGLPSPVPTLIRRARAGRGQRGRGLAIAADVARRHGGRLATAPSSHGARLVLELPSARPAPAAATADAPTDPHGLAPAAPPRNSDPHAAAPTAPAPLHSDPHGLAPTPPARLHSDPHAAAPTPPAPLHSDPHGAAPDDHKAPA